MQDSAAAIYAMPYAAAILRDRRQLGRFAAHASGIRELYQHDRTLAATLLNAAAINIHDFIFSFNIGLHQRDSPRRL